MAQPTASHDVLGAAEAAAEGARSRPTKPFWLRQPSSDFVRDPWFYIKYDLTWMALMLGTAGALFHFGWTGVSLEWGLSILPIAIAASYGQMLSNALIHNCSHGNLPRPINRLAGEVLGVIVATRYASWEILHRRHHMFSDDAEKDPHPIELSFWGFFWRKMLINLERNLHQQYYELWGDTPALRRRELVKSWISIATGGALFVLWYALLGPVGFWGVYVPALTIGVLHLTHFNWSTHNASRAKDESEIRPVNLDDGIYWFGNRLLFGAYMHANHHAFATVFNPLRLDDTRSAKVEAKIERMLRDK